MDISLLTYKLIYTYTHTPPGTDSGHLAQSVTIFLFFFFLTCWPQAATGIRQASASHFVIVVTPHLVVCCLIINKFTQRMLLIYFSHYPHFHAFSLSVCLFISLILSFFSVLLTHRVLSFFFFGALSCRVLVMQILTCSFGLLAINWNQQIDGSNSCSLATWYISRANIRTCQCSVIDTV